MDYRIDKHILFSEKTVISILSGTFVTLLLCSFILIPYVDSYYYWNWGRHLALSYYDGPPLIAYWMRLFAELLGNTTYSINILGVFSIFLTMLFIYKSAKMLFNKQIALNACLLWLFSTPVFHYLFLWVTYDNPLNLFWASTLYFSLRYIQYLQNRDIYLTGISAGLLLLSKYSGIVLLLSLFIFILYVSKYRTLFLHKHVYFSLLITCLILSPVILWNYQHDWGSLFYQFNYQLNIHKYKTSPWEAILRYLFKIIKSFDILLLLPIYVCWKLTPSISTNSYKGFPNQKENDSLLLLNWVSWFFIIFYLFISLQNSISKHWLTPLAISSAIVCAYYFSKYKLRNLFLFTMAIYILLGIYYLCVNCFFQQYFNEDYQPYQLIQKAGRKYLTTPMAVITSDWQTASRLSFWLPNKPNIRTLPCGVENQYAFWNQKTTDLNQVLYLDFVDHSDCIKQYFTHCHPLSPIKSKPHYFGFHLIPGSQLFAYYCNS